MPKKTKQELRQQKEKLRLQREEDSYIGVMPFWPEPIIRPEVKLKEFTAPLGKHILNMLLGAGPNLMASEVKEEIEKWVEDNPTSLESRHALWNYITSLQEVLRQKNIARKNVYNLSYLQDTFLEPVLDS